MNKRIGPYRDHNTLSHAEQRFRPAHWWHTPNSEGAHLDASLSSWYSSFRGELPAPENTYPERTRAQKEYWSSLAWHFHFWNQRECIQSDPGHPTTRQPGCEMQWSFSSLGRKWSQERDAQCNAHLQMNSSYCWRQELACPFKSFRVFVSTPIRYHSGRGEMVKHPKNRYHTCGTTTLLYPQTQWFTYFPISVVNVNGNGETLSSEPNITSYHQWENMMLLQGSRGACMPFGSYTWHFTPDPILFWFCFACKLVTGTFCGFLVKKNKNTLGCSQTERAEGQRMGYDGEEV